MEDTHELVQRFVFFGSKILQEVAETSEHCVGTLAVIAVLGGQARECRQNHWVYRVGSAPLTLENSFPTRLVISDTLRDLFWRHSGESGCEPFSERACSGLKAVLCPVRDGDTNSCQPSLYCRRHS